MKITILGKSPAWQDAGGACSGYLVEDGGTRLLLDCGNGVFSCLREQVDYLEVDAVVISHMHADHFIDLVPYAYALTYTPKQQPLPVAGWPGTDSPVRPRLFLPPGGAAIVRRIVGCWGPDNLVDAAFAVSEYDPAATLAVGPLSLRFQAVPHFVPTWAIDVRTAAAGPRLTFGADCAPNDELVTFAGGTDLLIAEATLPRPERDGDRGHLTPGEAGDHARRAGAERLVVTHFSDELDRDWLVGEASGAYEAAAVAAASGLQLDL